VGVRNELALNLERPLQVLGELPLTKCRVALDAVNLAEPAVKDGTASLLADTIAHLGQEVRSLHSFHLDYFCFDIRLKDIS